MATTNHPVQDWTALNFNDRVRVLETGRPAYMASVDTKTEDSSVVWIISDQGVRRAFDAKEGIRILPVTASSMGSAAPGRGENAV
jgi:hypothetical protein